MTDRRLSDATKEEIASVVAKAGEPRFRTQQVLGWIADKGVFDPQEMANLPKSLRTVLTDHFSVAPLKLRDISGSDDGTEKLLFEMSDGALVESVLIPTPDRVTVCLSSQVGCGVGCRFCASGLDGVKRNLTHGEIVEQFMLSRLRVRKRERELTNLVMMGMGEPMHNFENVLEALGRLNSEEGANFGARRITVSTVGIREGVERFTAAKTQYTLAFSLHAPNDEIRSEIVPLKSAMTVEELCDAAVDYLNHTGREVTFEYVLLRDLNDGREHADELVYRLRGIRCMVNVIPWNPVPGLPFERPPNARVDAFETQLIEGGLNVVVRRRRGNDIDAACGQLALKNLGR
ncbi:MAG: 23S rRNA (adenine(2503)-C(2))-methyltransferase RlmN [Planctomycetota bacterium]